VGHLQPLDKACFEASAALGRCARVVWRPWWHETSWAATVCSSTKHLIRWMADIDAIRTLNGLRDWSSIVDRNVSGLSAFA
jgi:hypothetical protein